MPIILILKSIPDMRSVVRQVMGNYTAEEIFSTKRKEVETQITQLNRRIVEKRLCSR